MIVFSIMMWFAAILFGILSFSLLKGNSAGMHGKVFDNTKDRKKYARAVGKPVLLLGIGLAVTGILAVAIQQAYSVLVAVAFLLLTAAVSGLWFGRILKRFS